MTGTSLVQKVRRDLGLGYRSSQADRDFSLIRQATKLVASEFIDFQQAYKLQKSKKIIRAVKACLDFVPE